MEVVLIHAAGQVTKAMLVAYGPMIVAAVICEAAGIFATFFLGLISAGGSFEAVDPPWQDVLSFSIFVPAILAGIGAAALVGPSSDLDNFVKAVVGVLAGIAAYSVYWVLRGQLQEDSAGLIAGNVLLLWVVAPAAGVIIAVVVTGSWIATIGAILALASLGVWFIRT